MDAVRLLLHSGAPAAGYDSDGWCLVAVAACTKNRLALRLLLEHGADVNGVGRDGSRAIHQAASRADLEIAKILVENGALLDFSSLRGNRFGTVLEQWASCAAELQISEFFSYPLENGAPVNAPEVIRGALRRNSLLTILLLRSAEDDLVRLVLSKGARVNEAKLPHTSGARTPVQAVAERGRLDLVRELHKRGAGINAPAGLDLGRTALQAACSAQRANMDLVGYLLDNGADVNAKAGFDGGLTAIQGAAMQGNIKLVALLLDRGADLNAEPAVKNGRTALDGAAEHGRLDMVHLLLSAGARCERAGLSGYDSSIELAKKEGRWEVADLLARAGFASRDENMYWGELGT
ncbi:ankyrin repeat-containing domain protein [Chaetomium tenue]|uniref:Ankyrin repeat-containing domain protein n=1 Tax=Chaetomium tenue TaxID=1854479 RepID=A0ACB7P9K2_9PEZI|nr:ankyrin repeat-containing domain protein [Chaetomium globosum]